MKWEEERSEESKNRKQQRDLGHGISRVKASLSIDETEETWERVKMREKVLCVTLRIEKVTSREKEIEMEMKCGEKKILGWIYLKNKWKWNEMRDESEMKWCWNARQMKGQMKSLEWGCRGTGWVGGSERMEWKGLRKREEGLNRLTGTGGFHCEIKAEWNEVLRSANGRATRAPMMGKWGQ